MNIYDTTNRLAKEIKESEEYINYKMAKEAIKMNGDLWKRIKEFDMMRYTSQLEEMQTGKKDQEKMKQVQEIYAELIERPEAKKYFEAETNFNILIADVNKIIGESIKDVME